MTTITHTTRSGERRVYVYSYSRPTALNACRTALQNGCLRRCDKHWILEHPYRRSRLFASATVNALVAAGEAVIVGDMAMARRTA